MVHVLIRREREDDVAIVRTITTLAFGRELEADIVDGLRFSSAWLERLSLVAVAEDRVIGHVVCSRAMIEDQPVLGLGPISVLPERQRTGVGLALMHAVLGAADALDEPLVGLLGNPAYYARFGFRRSTEFGVQPQDSAWGEYFQVRPLSAYRRKEGVFVYPEAFGV